MNILVTGGAGYIGSHTVRQLQKAGHRVVVYDNLWRGSREAAGGVPLVVGDMQDCDRLAGAIYTWRIEAVIHFAAAAYVGESVTDPELYYAINIGGTANLIRAMRRFGVNKLVFSSTTATYGVPDALPIGEDHPQNPINPYGFTKLAIERMLADCSRAYGFGYAALRYFNAAGASEDATLGEDHWPETHLIPLALFAAIGRGPELTIFGDDYPTPDGTCIRDYIHVDDLAAAHVKALDRLEPGKGLCLNLGTGRGHSVREVIESCQRVTAMKVPTTVGPRRSGDPPALIADASRAMAELDWQPRYTDLDEIVKTAFKWHRTHPRGHRTPALQRSELEATCY